MHKATIDRITKLKALLNEAADINDELRADSRELAGDIDLVFWPLVRPDATRHGSDLVAWQARVDNIIAAAQHADRIGAR